MPIPTESTTFTRDVLGRYLCNTLGEADATDLRRFNIIIVGGGSFGAAIAEQLFQLDIKHKQHRILVLEGGPFLLTEHMQNLPPMHAGLGPPSASTIEELRNQWQQQNPNQPVPALLPPRNEVWGLAWHSRAVPQASDPKDKRFPGLAYCVGGRSLSWGGWSPELINSELTDWPPEVVSDLKGGYFGEARRQLGTDVSNDFIFGPLHDSLRSRLAAGLSAVTNALPITSENDLEAPLAVQSAAPRSGFFPFNKFSAVPLLLYAARQAEAEFPGNDFKKRLMVVPNCHVVKLHLDGSRRINRIQANLGDIPVLPNSVVIVALGTVESTRLALLSFPNSNGLIGKNLMAHLRSNTTIRIPRSAFAGLPDELEASALFVKGRTRANGHFHLQITACGVRGNVKDSEAELNKKIPDLDDLERIKAAISGIQDDYVVVTLRGIGEMVGDKTLAAASRVDLDPELDEHGVNRAIVSMSLSSADQALWAAMDTAATQAAHALANGHPLEFLNTADPANHFWQAAPFVARDGLGTTHHEGGTLWMGTDPNGSVTDTLGRFHEVSNAFAIGPALFPSVGSPNPMLGGMALLRRTARRLVPADVRPAIEPDFTPLFDGAAPAGWQMAGPGTFTHEQMTDDRGQAYGVLRSEGGMGLFWYTPRTFQNFLLRLEWRLTRADDNSGVFVRFPNPGNDPWVAVNQGYEVQIDDLGRDNSGQPGNPLTLTGAIYSFAAPLRLRSRLVGQWNEYEIRVQGQQYLVALNGEPVLAFTGSRSLAGHIGIQNHSASSRVFFRNIRVKELPVS